MIVRKTNNSMYNISKLRNLWQQANNDIQTSKERISLIHKLVQKLILKRALFKVVSLFIADYRKETIALGKNEIINEKRSIKNNIITFEHFPSKVSYLIDKLNVLINQLRKMRVFYRLDGTFYNYEQLDLQDITRHYFQMLSRRDQKIVLDDELNFYEFNSLFVGMYNRKYQLLEMFSYDNIAIEMKDIDYETRSRRNALALKSQKWLYQNKDGSKDQRFKDNYIIYIYTLKALKITFNGKNVLKDFVFLGNDSENMNLFYTLLTNYLKELRATNYEILDNNEYTTLHKERLLEYLFQNDDYGWIIFQILNDNLEVDKIEPHNLVKKYHLHSEDVLKIIEILKKFEFIEVSLGLDLIPKYKKNEIIELFTKYKNHYQQNILRGESNGQTD